MPFWRQPLSLRSARKWDLCLFSWFTWDFWRYVNSRKGWLFLSSLLRLRLFKDSYLPKTKFRGITTFLSLRSYDDCCNENVTLKYNLSVLQLFHVGCVAQNRQSAISLAWHGWLSCKAKEWKIYCSGLASAEHQVSIFHVVIWQTTSKKKKRNKKRTARSARFISFIQPIKSLIFGVVVVVAVIS